MKLANRYETSRELGRGGMGVVYLARDPVLDRDVAVKLISQISDDRKQRFMREARVIAKMDHPGIVGVYDLGEHEDGLFFVMPYVPGINLRQMLSESPLKLRQLVELGIQAAEALEYSHELGVVHRDIKPENIMVAAHTVDSVRSRITDFGLAISATEQRLTTTGALVGTVSYLSPEQVIGGPAAARVDVYALGTVLYECIAGRTPFKGEIQSVLFRIVHEEPQPLSQLVQDIDGELEHLVLSCLHKDPELRPRRAADVAVALTRYRAKIINSARAAETMRTIEIRAAGGVPPPAAPFVGRAKELAELQNRLNAAVTGESQLVLVEGEAGVGKTRLVEELERLLHARHIRVLTGNFNEQDGATPYQGFCEMLEAHMRRASASSTELAEIEDELVAVFPILGELRAARTRSAVAHRSSPAAGAEQDRVSVFDLLARALARIAGTEPLVIVLEDLHRATVSVEALQYIARRLGPTRTLLLATYTPAEVDRAHPITKLVDGFKGNKRFSLVHLDRFTPEEHRSFLATVSLGATIDETLASKLYDASEGNPYFTRELFRSLLDTGNITREGQGSYQLSGGPSLAFDTIPSTIQKAVERRLERLPDELREVLSVASALGKSFEEHELEAILDDDAPDLDDALDKLVRGGFLEEERKARGERLAFTSGTMREVLYAELPRRKRRGLHKKVAEHLEDKHKGRLDRVRAQLVHHFAQADVADKVVAYGLELARAALATFSADEAVRAAKSVLGFIEDDDRLEAEARRLLASAHRMAGDFDAALKELEAAIKVHERAADPAQALAAYVEAAFTAWDSRRVVDAKRWIDKGIKAARAVADTAVLAKLLPLGITVANLRGDAATSRELIEEVERMKKVEPIDHGASAGGAVRIALLVPVRVVEPALVSVDEESEVLSNAFETLLTTDEQGNTVPCLAELWESHDAGARFTFTLRKNLVWHDGNPVTADDVKASFERTAALSRERPALAVSAMRAIDVTGPLTLSIALHEPLPIFPGLLTDFRCALARDGGAFPLGTGSFKLASVTAERVVLERHDRHWRDRPAIDALEYHVGLASSTIAAGFRAGNYDVVRDLPLADLEEMLRDRRLGARSAERPKKNVCFVLFKSGTPAPLRAALCETIATHDLVWRHLGRLARPAEGLIPPGVLGHDAGRRHASMTRERGLELLAGTPATTLRCAVHPVLLDRYRGAIDALFEAWAALGVSVEITSTDMPSYLAQIRAPENIDVVIQRWAADYNDPDSFTFALFDSKVGTRRGLYSTPELDAALREARLEPAPHKRAAMYRTIEEGLLAAHVILPLWHDEDLRLYGPRVRNLALKPIPPYIDVATVRTQAASAATSAQIGGVLAVAFDVGVTSLDPVVANTAEDMNILSAVFEPLTREIGGARVVPWLAESVIAEDSGKRFRVILRDGVRFHDGRPLTARDVRYSVERALASVHTDALSYHARNLVSVVGAREIMTGTRTELAGLRIHSARELTFELESPLPAFVALLSHVALGIVPEGSMPRGRTSFRDGCVGTGAFRVVRSDPGRKLELEPNPAYWRAGLPRSGGVSFSFGVPSNEAIARLRAGQCSIVVNPSPAEAERLWSEPAYAANCRTVPQLSTYVLVFNCVRGPFADVKTRRAVAAAIDADALARGYGRAITPAHSVLPPGLLGHDATDAAPRSRTHTALDLDVTLLVAPAFRARYDRYASSLLDVLASTGLRVKVGEQPGLLSVGQPSSYDLFLGRWVGDFPDPDTFMTGALGSTTGMWGGMIGNRALDARIQQIRFESDHAVRAAACRDVETVVRDQAALVPLFHDRLVLFAHPTVRGLTEDVLTSSGMVDFAALSRED